MSSEHSTSLIQSELTDLDANFTKYFSTTDEKFTKEWNQQYDHDSLSKAKAAAIESVIAVHEALHRRLDEICHFYLTADGKCREWLREFVSSRRSLLLALRDHVHWCARRIQSATDRELLRNGIAAISLQDNRLDFRDNYIALGHLYLAAVKTGIQPSLDLHKIGLLSSTLSRTKWPSDSTQNFLTGFEESAYFKESIVPKLP